MAELDVRTAQEQARKMHAYVDSFNGQTFSPALDSVDRQNLATALDNLLETAAMLGNVSDRLATKGRETEPAVWGNFPCYLIDHCEGETISEEGLQRALAAMLADPKYATPPAVMPAAPSDAVLRGIYYSAHDALGLAEWTKRARAALSQTMQPQAGAAPDDLKLTLLMAPYHLNLVVGRDRTQLLAFGRDVWAAAKRGDSPTVRTRNIAEANAAHAVGTEGKEVPHGTATTSAAGTTAAPVNPEGRDSVTNAQAEPAAGEQVARNWIHGEAIDYLEVPDVQDESGINAHYSRDLVLQCIDAAIDAAIEAGKEQAGAVAQTPMFFASAEQANALQDRPDDDEGGVYLPLRKTAAGKFTMPLYAAPSVAIAAREQEDAVQLLGKYRKLCVEIGRGDSYHLGRIDRAISALASREEVPAAPQGDNDWRICNSAGRPILVYKNCSVIEAEDAEYVLRLIGADRAALTQPTTVQQEPTFKRWKISDKFRAMQQHPEGQYYAKDEVDYALRGLQLSACNFCLEQAAEARAALKGMQPGERKEGAE